MANFDESYVREILAAARSKRITTKQAFDEMTRPDINAGYRAEVNEAFRRLNIEPPLKPGSRQGGRDE